MKTANIDGKELSSTLGGHVSGHWKQYEDLKKSVRIELPYSDSTSWHLHSKHKTFMRKSRYTFIFVVALSKMVKILKQLKYPLPTNGLRSGSVYVCVYTQYWILCSCKTGQNYEIYYDVDQNKGYHFDWNHCHKIK